MNELEKNSNPRIFAVSQRLSSMFNLFPKKDELVFGKGRMRDKQNTFLTQRCRLAEARQSKIATNNSPHPTPLERNNGIS